MYEKEKERVEERNGETNVIIWERAKWKAGRRV